MSEYIITSEQLNFFTSYMPDDAMIPAKDGASRAYRPLPRLHMPGLERCRRAFLRAWHWINRKTRRFLRMG